MVEFNHHRGAIIKQVEDNIKLMNMKGELPLKGIMLSPEASHHGAKNIVSHITVMGKFILNNPNNNLAFHIGLYGQKKMSSY